MSEHTGRFVWYDLMTSDVEAAKTFYTQLIGWDLQGFDKATEDKPYTMWVGPKGPLGGVATLPDEAVKMGAPPHWVAYTYSDDLEATATMVKELGGEVLVPPTAIAGTGGAFAVLRDPQGAVFAAYGGDQSDDAGEDAKGPGTFTWHELGSTDFDKSFEFYAAVFGWTKTDSMDMGGGNIYLMYGKGDKTLGGMFTVSPDMPAQPGWLHYISVADCDKVTEKAKALGAKVLHGPMDVPGGDRICQLVDPQGAAFALHSSAS